MLELRSQGFEHGGEIPRVFTCEGADVSPPLIWAGEPDSTQSLVLIVNDPDAPDPAAPTRVWVHWLLYNIPAWAKCLAQGVRNNELPPGTLQGRNDWGRTGYGGPCPPIGRHRYFHRLFALDTLLPDLHEPTSIELMKAMQGHVLAEAELVGTYEKSGTLKP